MSSAAGFGCRHRFLSAHVSVKLFCFPYIYNRVAQDQTCDPSGRCKTYPNSRHIYRRDEIELGIRLSPGGEKPFKGGLPLLGLIGLVDLIPKDIQARARWIGHGRRHLLSLR